MCVLLSWVKPLNELKTKTCLMVPKLDIHEDGFLVFLDIKLQKDDNKNRSICFASIDPGKGLSFDLVARRIKKAQKIYSKRLLFILEMSL